MKSASKDSLQQKCKWNYNNEKQKAKQKYELCWEVNNVS